MPYILVVGKVLDAGLDLRRNAQGVTLDTIEDAEGDAYLIFLMERTIRLWLSTLKRPALGKTILHEC